MALTTTTTVTTTPQKKRIIVTSKTSQISPSPTNTAKIAVLDNEPTLIRRPKSTSGDLSTSSIPYISRLPPSSGLIIAPPVPIYEQVGAGAIEQACGIEGSALDSVFKFQSFTGNILFTPIPAVDTIPFNIVHQYGRRRRWEHASGYGRALMKKGTADYAQGMLAGMRGEGRSCARIV
ncbi:hypothetical protein EDD85DRAFT_963090 [Armillaria nabsnona]|nr:hypothetical protein EDD85DRAFT_963090 [Armillaria nabsnona]